MQRSSHANYDIVSASQPFAARGDAVDCLGEHQQRWRLEPLRGEMSLR
jgi:hypothetical protein